MQVLHRFLVVQKQLKVYLIINQKEFNYMEYTAGLFANFLTKLISLDKDVKSTISEADRKVSSRDSKELSEWHEVQNRLSQIQNLRASKSKNVLTNYRNSVEEILSKEISDKMSSFARLEKCKEVLSLIISAESSIINKKIYNSSKTMQSHPVNISLEDLITGKTDFIEMAYAVNTAIQNGKKKEISRASIE